METPRVELRISGCGSPSLSFIVAEEVGVQLGYIHDSRTAKQDVSGDHDCIVSRHSDFHLFTSATDSISDQASNYTLTKYDKTFQVRAR